MQRIPAPPGRFISIQTRRIHIQECGAGTPVLFEAGAGEWSSHWETVITRLNGQVRAIAYDRAGLGWSDPVNGNRAAPVLADELIELLNVLHIMEPVILVAHSFGASVVRLVADHIPDKVLGIVFVDGWHESFEAWEQTNAPPRNRYMHLIDALDRFGLFHLLNRILPAPKCPWPLLSQQTWNAMLAINASSQFHAAAMQESSAFAAGDAAVAAVNHLTVPVITLVAEETITPQQMPSGYPVHAHNQAWRIASAHLASLFAQSEIRLLAGTDHMIQLQQPDAVVQAIMDIHASSRIRNSFEKLEQE